MLTEHQVEQLKAKYYQFCQEIKIASDLYDIEAKIDRNITFWENWGIIEDELKVLKENGTLLKEQAKKSKIEQEREAQEREPCFDLDLDLTDSVVILGDRNSGKTNLAFYFMNNYKGSKKKYLYGYPKFVKGYNLISSWSDLLKLTDSLILIDEIQKYIKLYDQRANVELMELLGFLAQQNNTLIFTTQLSQFITKGVEASIQTWVIKQIDVVGLKNGSKPKRIIKETANPRITDKGMAISVNEFIAWDSTMPIGFNGIHTFEDQGIGKDWKTPTKIATKIATKIQKDLKTSKISIL